MPENSNYLAVVRSAVADALGLEEDDVRPDATVLGELGAESIDLLDVLFRIERVAGIRLLATEIADQLQGDLTDDQFEGPGGVITPVGLDQLRRVLPQIDPSELTGKVTADSIMTLFTVRNLADMIATRAAGAANVNVNVNVHAN